MFEIIERLRQKPERTKKSIAFLSAFFFSGIILVIWLTVIYPDFMKDNARQSEVLKNDSTPISNINDSFSDVGEQFSKLKELLSMFSSKPEYYVATSTNSNISTSTKANTSVSTTTEEAEKPLNY